MELFKKTLKGIVKQNRLPRSKFFGALPFLPNILLGF